MNCTDSTRVKRIIYVAIHAQWDLNTKACSWKEKRICSCDTLGNLKSHNSRDSTWQGEDSKHDTCTNLAPLVDFETQMERQTGTKHTHNYRNRGDTFQGKWSIASLSTLLCSSHLLHFSCH